MSHTPSHAASLLSEADSDGDLSTVDVEDVVPPSRPRPRPMLSVAAGYADLSDASSRRWTCSDWCVLCALGHTALPTSLTSPPALSPLCRYLFEVFAGVWLLLALRNLAVARMVWYWTPTWMLVTPFVVDVLLCLVPGVYAVHGARTRRKAGAFVVFAALETTYTFLLTSIVGAFVAERIQEPTPGHPVHPGLQWMDARLKLAGALEAVSLTVCLLAVVMVVKYHTKWRSCHLTGNFWDPAIGPGVALQSLAALCVPSLRSGAAKRRQRQQASAMTSAALDDDVPAPPVPSAHRRRATRRDKRTQKLWRYGALSLLYGPLCVWLLVMLGLGIMAYVATQAAEPLDSASSDGHCDPLDESACALPFPSSFYQDAAPDTATGFRLAFGASSLPSTRFGHPSPSHMLNRADGFSTVAPILFGFHRTVATHNLIPWTHIERFQDANATTVLVDATTGARVAHWTERDAWQTDFGAARPPLLIMQPAAPLEHAHRYVVGVTGLLQDDGAGTPIEAWPAFAALRDNVTHGAVPSARRAKFDHSVFPVLAAAGVPRTQLQLAFDFTTASVGNSLGRAMWVRDDALARLPAAGVPFTIDAIENHEAECVANGSQRVARWVWGHFDGPN